MSVETAFLTKLREWIAAETKLTEARIIEGRLADFSEYRYSLGYKKALDDVALVSDQFLEEIQKG